MKVHENGHGGIAMALKCTLLSGGFFSLATEALFQRNAPMTRYDIIIIGGGPAGLSAALIAGRARLNALMIDGGTPRNAAAPALHSFVSRDGILPEDFRRICHEELARYATVSRCEAKVVSVTGHDGAFDVLLEDGAAVHGAKIVLALGLIDTLPDIAGLRDAWGRGVHHCPFCDGYEHGGEHWGVLADQPAVLDHALFLKHWAVRMTVFVMTDASEEQLEALRAAGVTVERSAVTRVIVGDGHVLGGIETADGRVHDIQSLWVRPAQSQTALVQGMGLDLRDDGAIWRNEMGETSVPGVTAGGDCAAGQMQQAIFAAADGVKAVFPAVRALVMGAG
jgi:thioredoxin reductase